MASLVQERTKSDDPKTNGQFNRRWRLQFVAPNGDRKAIRLGEMKASEAERVREQVDALVKCAKYGLSLDEKLAGWLNGLHSKSPKVYAKLVRDGLAPRRADDPAIAPAPTVRKFIDGYLQGRKSDVKPRTLSVAQQDADSLCEFLDTLRPVPSLAEVNRGTAKDYFSWLKANGYAEATISRRIVRCREFFADAIDRELIAKNPFAKFKAGSQENKAREFFITREMTEKLLGACPDGQWRLIVALARYGGLRTPSETLALTWDDIDWDRGRIRITSTKTAHHKGKGERLIPLFPELRQHLNEAWDLLEPGDSPYVIHRYRDTSANLRTHFVRIIRKAGLLPWERVFHNLRGSRQNELIEQGHPVHVVCDWIGNSALIAKKHYLHVLDSDFDRALAGNVKTSGAHSVAHHSQQEAQEPTQASAAESHGSENAAPVGSSRLQRFQATKGIPPAGFEGQRNPREKRAISHSVSHSGADVESDRRLAAIVAAWPALPESIKDELAERVAERTG